MNSRKKVNISIIALIIIIIMWVTIDYQERHIEQLPLVITHGLVKDSLRFSSDGVMVLGDSILSVDKNGRLYFVPYRKDFIINGIDSVTLIGSKFCTWNDSTYFDGYLSDTSYAVYRKGIRDTVIFKK